MTKTLTEQWAVITPEKCQEINALFSGYEKKIERLQEQLAEANEVIESLRTYDFTVDDENAEYYQVKWNVEAKRFYKNRKWGIK